MKLIVNVDNEWNIGNDGDLVFPIREDMKFFRTTTSGKVVVMGRKTLDSFPGGNPLKNRVNIVLTRDNSFEREGAVITHSVEETLEKLKEYNSDDVYVIGGAEIYKMFLDYCDTAVVTHVDAVAEKADKKFPDISSKPEWTLCEKSEEKEENGIKFTFCTYKKKM
ncbi:MAG: dihydrofolate reductase [Clostridia bacterium]|nr:dihydrofolate reductase [Clostridia bacterium]